MGEIWYWGSVRNVVLLVSIQYEPITYLKATSTSSFFSLAPYKQYAVAAVQNTDLILDLRV